MSNQIEKITKYLDDLKATRIVSYDVEKKVSYTNHIIICSASSSTHCNAIVKKLHIFLKDMDILPNNPVKSIANTSWTLIDYGQFVVHIFYGEDREKYNLEEIFEKPRI